MIKNDDYLEHHGVKGQTWGVRNGPPYPLAAKEKNISELVKSTTEYKYKNFDKLMSPDEVRRTKSGSCHDMVLYEIQELKRMGYDAKGLFMMEYSNGQGGMTHSLAYYENEGKYYWVEPYNTWPERFGCTPYNSLNDIKKEIKKAHNSGEFGDNTVYKNIIFGKFDPSEHEIGEDLQSLVDRCLN